MFRSNLMIPVGIFVFSVISLGVTYFIGYDKGSKDQLVKQQELNRLVIEENQKLIDEVNKTRIELNSSIVHENIKIVTKKFELESKQKQIDELLDKYKEENDENEEFTQEQTNTQELSKENNCRTSVNTRLDDDWLFIYNSSLPDTPTR